MCGQGMQAMSYLEASAFIYTNGCIDKLVNWIHSNLFLLGGIALGLAVPQVTRAASPGDWGGEGTILQLCFARCVIWEMP